MKIDFNATSDQNATSGRLIKLQDAAYRVRQHSISAGGDLEGWKLARTMRDATSYAEANAADRQLSAWLKTRTLALSPVAT